MNSRRKRKEQRKISFDVFELRQELALQKLNQRWPMPSRGKSSPKEGRKKVHA
jgi:hypothetical protein